MRLIRRKVRKLEAAAAAEQIETRPVALAWTEDNVRLPEDVELGVGEHVATDIYVLEHGDFFGPSGMPSRYKVVERVSAADGDTGTVYEGSEGGRAIGRVRSADPFLEIEWFEAAQ